MSGRFNLNDYVTVDERIDRFWADYPDGAIRTELIYTNNDGGSVAIRALVYKRCEQPQPDATGIAQEDRLTGLDQYGKPVKGANTTSWWENCETSAIGRALANLGMSLSKQRPSREEMQKVERYDQRQRDPDDDLPEYVPPRATSAAQSNGTAPARVPTPPDLDANLLARIRDDNAQPEFRRKALHTYFNGATDIGVLAVRRALVATMGLPADDIAKLYDWHLARLRDQPAPAEVR